MANTGSAAAVFRLLGFCRRSTNCDFLGICPYHALKQRTSKLTSPCFVACGGDVLTRRGPFEAQMNTVTFGRDVQLRNSEIR